MIINVTRTSNIQINNIFCYDGHNQLDQYAK